MRILIDGLHHLIELFDARRPETLQSFLGEKLQTADLPQVSQKRTVGSAHNVSVIVAKDFPGDGRWPARPVLVMNLHELLGNLGRGSNDQWRCTHAQVHEGTMFLCQMPQHLVKVRSKLMHVADERKRSGTRWSLILEDLVGDHPNSEEGNEPKQDEQRIHCSNELLDTHDPSIESLLSHRHALFNSRKNANCFKQPQLSRRLCSQPNKKYESAQYVNKWQNLFQSQLPNMFAKEISHTKSLLQTSRK